MVMMKSSSVYVARRTNLWREFQLELRTRYRHLYRHLLLKHMANLSMPYRATNPKSNLLIL